MSKGFKLREHGDLAYLTIPAFDETNLVTHCFTTRKGGFSQEPFSSLNMALHVKDDPTAVCQNRAKICNALGIRATDLVTGEQVHGENILVITEQQKGKGALDYSSTCKAVDAFITNKRSIPLSTFYADCAPIFILDPVTPAISLAHAGWKGTVAKIGAKAMLKMQQEFGTKPEDCLIGIGPSIGPCCYEVDERVISQFAQKFSNYQDFIQAKAPGKWLLDLWQANKTALLEVGIREKNITNSGFCTNCHNDLFFSYRAENGQTGRMAALLMLN
ncbi:peptidoglycan editing factor PgeF [Bacillota bacterium LX-D]|nr:peptidoglycan editing factor PgeF [Bacillota bacterium LX-D]